VIFSLSGYVLEAMRWTVLALVLGLVLTGCGPARESAGSFADSAVVHASVAPAQVTTKIERATPKQETVLREIIAGLGAKTRIDSVQVSPVRDSGEPDDPEAVGIEPHIAPGAAVRGDWEVWLLAGAFAQRSRALRLPRVANVSGLSLDSGPEGGSSEPRDAVTTEALITQVKTGARKSQAELVELELLRPQNVALHVSLRVDDPAAFLASRASMFFSTVESPEDAEYDGLFVEVFDRDAKLVWSYSLAVSEYGGASSWGYTRPDLVGCDPIHESRGPRGNLPPPCPTDEAEFHVETVAPSDVTTKIVGGTPKQQGVLRKILSGLGPTRLESVEIVSDVEKGWGAPPNAVGFESKAVQPDGYSYWQGQLAGDAFGELSLELGLPPVAYIGDEEEQSGGFDFSTDPSKAPLTPAEAEHALRRVAEIAKRSGATTRARVLKPRRLALAVDFRAEKPAEFLLKGLQPALAPIEDPHASGFDGLYVKVMDAKGRRVLENGAGYWVRPDLADCSPYLSFGSSMAPPPPPCPVEAKSPN
jgi:hypothetical protein